MVGVVALELFVSNGKEGCLFPVLADRVFLKTLQSSRRTFPIGEHGVAVREGRFCGPLTTGHHYAEYRS